MTRGSLTVVSGVSPERQEWGGEIFHLHINAAFARQDLNCVMPLEHLADLAASGEVGDSAPSHYSYVGYTLRPERLLHETVPSIVQRISRDTR